MRTAIIAAKIQKFAHNTCQFTQKIPHPRDNETTGASLRL